MKYENQKLQNKNQELCKNDCVRAKFFWLFHWQNDFGLLSFTKYKNEIRTYLVILLGLVNSYISKCQSAFLPPTRIHELLSNDLLSKEVLSKEVLSKALNMTFYRNP